MEVVYANDSKIITSPNGILDLSILRLCYITLQGFAGLVDEKTSKTLYSWDVTKRALRDALKDEYPDALGSKDSPLQVTGIPRPEAGGLLLP